MIARYDFMFLRLNFKLALMLLRGASYGLFYYVISPIERKKMIMIKVKTKFDWHKIHRHKRKERKNLFVISLRFNFLRLFKEICFVV